jgi:hypothetical protein
MSVPSKVKTPLRRLPLALLVVLIGCRSTPPAAPAPPAPQPDPPPVDRTPPLDVVERTRHQEEALETVWIELSPAAPGSTGPREDSSERPPGSPPPLGDSPLL